MTDAFSDIEEWILATLRPPSAGPEHGVEDIDEVAAHPTRPLVACTVTVRDPGAEETVRAASLVDLASGRLTRLPHRHAGRCAWSPDGRLLAVLVADEGSSRVLVLDTDDPRGTPRHELPVLGLAESAAWSPDGLTLALVVAEPGADISDAYGSGSVAGPADDQPSWRPRVLPSTEGRRRLLCWPVTTPVARPVTSLNVWEVAWRGERTLVALTSEGAGEDDWYGAVLTDVQVDDGSARTLVEGPRQLAGPSAPPSGDRWSVVSAWASDRGLVAGDLLMGTADGTPQRVDTAGVDVTQHHWLDEGRILLTGLRGLDTVVSVVDVRTGHVEEVWAGPETTGRFQPEVAGSTATGPVVVLEEHRRPPRLGRLAATGFTEVLSTESEATARLAARVGTLERRSWTSSDGTAIEGLLALPDRDGPHALVVHVHGGPVYAWRNAWTDRDPHTQVLVARGYAVLCPNPRGSTGHGADFAHAVIGDVGGMDVEDVLAGVRSLVDEGLVDPARIGITGISYGGFMSAWMVCGSDVFAASVSRSPATDMLTQHLTSNIGEFDRRFLRGDVFDPESHYRTRSPLYRQHEIDTPMLLTAGALDLATPASQAQVLYTALKERGVPAGLVVYPEEGHGVQQPRALVDQCARMVEWFERFMSP